MLRSIVAKIRQLKVSTGFTRRTAVYVIAFGRNIVALMTGSIPFANPFPPLATVTDALDAADAAVAAAMNRGKQQIIERHAAMANLIELLCQLAAFVQGRCQNDLALLNSTGFEAVKTGTKVGPLPTSLPPKTSQTPVSGKMAARVKRVNGAYTYNWQLALASAPNVYVQTAQTTSARVEFGGLIPGEVYNVQVQAVGAAGASNWSNAGSIRVI